MRTIREFLKTIKSQLRSLIPEEEVDSHYWLIVDHLFHVPYYELIATHDYSLYERQQESVSAETAEALTHILAGLAEGVPIQYLLGEAYFYGRKFLVTPDVLIPRGETEMLCHHVLGDKGALRGLDLCTGSGVIAITLALENPEYRIDALDISPKALAIARENARMHNVQVNFIEGDLYTWKPAEAKRPYDFIIANPPYIPAREAASLPSRVRDYEPSLALFVPDEDPLRPYRRIVELALKHLEPRMGELIFEVHENFAEDVAELCRQAGFHYVDIKYDLRDKPRMVVAVDLWYDAFCRLRKRYGG